jgi:hypothetical protein
MSEAFGLEAPMDTLHDRLTELAKDAPTRVAPAAELWARGKRTSRIRAAALAATLLVVGAVGTGIGVRLADVDGNRSYPSPASSVVLSLPIEYPVGEELPNLGDAPGPLAAIWLSPRAGGGAPEAVGLVAETGTFGTLPIDLSSTYYAVPDPYLALSPDGRRIAYHTPMEELVVRDLVSGETYSPAFGFKIRGGSGYTWIDDSHLVGHVARGTDVDGWVWEPGTAPKLVDLRAYPGSPWLGPQAGVDPWFLTHIEGDDAWSCLSLQDVGGGVRMPVLCDVLGVLGSEIVLTHDGSGAVVALDIHGVEDPALRRVVATAGGPQRVTFATDLIGDALAAEGGAS